MKQFVLRKIHTGIKQIGKFRKSRRENKSSKGNFFKAVLIVNHLFKFIDKLSFLKDKNI